MYTFPPTDATWLVARVGAYMHYAVPRILNRIGRLDKLHTDFYADDLGSRILARLPLTRRLSLVNRATGRVAHDLPRERIRSYPLLGVQSYLRRILAQNEEARSNAYLREGIKFASRVAKEGFGKAGAVYTFNTGALEVLLAAKQKGLYTAHEQTIAPRVCEEELLAEEQARHPGWEPLRSQGPSTRAIIGREREEWNLADVIVCGSEFVRAKIDQYGGPADRCVVVPYGVDNQFTPSIRDGRTGPLRVLTVGEAGLRKGIQYAAETARMLQEAAEFRWVGAVSLSSKGRAQVEPFIDLRGIVPRNQVLPEFAWADVFFLPTVCEGSATSTYEALMSGLPVLTTPNAGSLVRDGVDGFLVDLRDTRSMADRLFRLYEDRSLLQKMSAAARDSARETSLDAYQARLFRALGICAS